ncbi:MAG: hypothetical protein OXI87_19370 [Albidovulum sp.]|nr:hypothetical protein [Albidovulum sp.]
MLILEAADALQDYRAELAQGLKGLGYGIGKTNSARGLDHGRHWSTDAALARESETIALMRTG